MELRLTRTEIVKDISQELLNNKLCNHLEKRKIETQEEISRSREMPGILVNSGDINAIQRTKIPLPNTKLLCKITKGYLVKYILDYLPISESLQLSKLKNKKINESLIKAIEEQKMPFCDEIFIKEEGVLRFNLLTKGVSECSCGSLACVECCKSKCLACKEAKLCSLCYYGCKKKCGSSYRYCSGCIEGVLEDYDVHEEKSGLCFECRLCENCTKMYYCGCDNYAYCESHWSDYLFQCKKCKGYYCSNSCCRCCHDCRPTRSYRGSDASDSEENEKENINNEEENINDNEEDEN